MPPNLRRTLHNPFDEYEMELLELIAKEQALVAEWAHKAQVEADSDELALHSYVEHMAALSRSRAYGTALYLYRKRKAMELVGGKHSEV